MKKYQVKKLVELLRDKRKVNADCKRAMYKNANGKAYCYYDEINHFLYCTYVSYASQKVYHRIIYVMFSKTNKYYFTCFENVGFDIIKNISEV